MKKKKKAAKYKYEDFEEVIEKVVEQKASQFIFGYHGEEDIAQMIRIICADVVKNYNPEKLTSDKAINYFGTCVENRMKNVIRDTYFRYEIPCKSRKCVAYDKETGCSKEPRDCKAWVKYKNNLIAHTKINNPINIGIVLDYASNSNDRKTSDKVLMRQCESGVFYLKTSIVEKIKETNPDLLEPFHRLLNNNSISPNDLRQIRKIAELVME